jgi:hypothetical protein
MKGNKDPWLEVARWLLVVGWLAFVALVVVTLSSCPKIGEPPCVDSVKVLTTAIPDTLSHPAECYHSKHRMSIESDRAFSGTWHSWLVHCTCGFPDGGAR